MAGKDRALDNVTITIAPETAAKARVRAAERGMSLSRYIGEVLREHLGRDDAYGRAMRSYLGRGPFEELKGAAPQRYPKREELYDRKVFRRR
jgi:hypothetical protein